MKIIVFRLSDGRYLGYKLLEDKAEILIQFFLSDVGPCGIAFKNFINDLNRESTSSNYCLLIKHGADMLISCQFDEDPYEYGIEITQQNLLLLLDQWDELIKLRPQEIIVYKEGELYRLEGHGFPDKQE